MINSPYFLLPLIFLSFLFYLMSYLLAGYGVITRTFHRRMWNVLLLLVFLTTAALGLLLVIQINYKLEWPLVKTLLKWHVNFGIALSLVAVFHFTWHLNYYLKILKPVKRQPVPGNDRVAESLTDGNSLLPLILLCGFIATAVQVLMLREITSVFGGNELMMGWTLGIWMLMTGTGAFLGRKNMNPGLALRLLRSMILLLGVIPILMVLLMTWIRNSMFPPGIAINPVYFLIILFTLLAPAGILSGLAFSTMVHRAQPLKNGIIRVYAFESAGSLAGGLVVSLVLINRFSVLQSMVLILILITLILYFQRRDLYGILYIGLAALMLTLTWVLPVDKLLKSRLYPGQKIAESRETYYGNVTITENEGQYSFFENGLLLFVTDNVISSEEYVHYAMLQRPGPSTVLLIGGGISGMLKEILKYPSVKKLDYVELNPGLIKMASGFVTIPADKKIRVIPGDGRRFLRHTPLKYDVVILAIPDPSSLQVNRFYTDEFIRLLKQRLTSQGLVLFSHSPAGNYVSPVMAEMEGVLYHTLAINFRNLELIPGDRDYFIASDSTVTCQVAGLPAIRHIETNYVNSNYLDDFVIKQRSSIIKASISRSDGVNSDWRPLPVFLHTLHFLSEYGNRAFYFLWIPLVLLLLPVFFMRPLSGGIYTAGFTASSFELMILFAFQIFYGYVYSAIGIIIAVFMGGLAAGSLLCRNWKIKDIHFTAGQGLLVIFMIVLPGVLYVTGNVIMEWTQFLIILVITLFLSSLVGFLYAAGTKLMGGELSRAASVLYASDLLGSSLGVIAVTVVLLPFLGVNKSCWAIGGMNLVAAVIYHFKT